MARPEDSGVSRRQFIGLAGGSVAAASLLAACGSEDTVDASIGQFGKGDGAILNYLLTLEYVEAAFYTELAASELLGAEARRTVAKFGREEEEHVSSLTAEIEKLGGTPAEKPDTSFSLETEDAALEVASALENVGAAAYLGQLPNIKSDQVLKTVLSIHSVEGRHAGAVNNLLKKPLTPDGAFAKPATVKKALTAVQPYLS
jgi:rubrerythrin